MIFKGNSQTVTKTQPFGVFFLGRRFGFGGKYDDNTLKDHKKTFKRLENYRVISLDDDKGSLDAFKSTF